MGPFFGETRAFARLVFNCPSDRESFAQTSVLTKISEVCLAVQNGESCVSETENQASSEQAKTSSLEKAFLVARTAQEHRGQDIVILDMRDLMTLFDFFVIASGTSRRQLHAMSEHIDEALSRYGARRLGIEGFGESRWILLDYGDVVVHLFDPETRAFYALEDLWAHAPRVPVGPLAPATDAGPSAATGSV